MIKKLPKNIEEYQTRTINERKRNIKKHRRIYIILNVLIITASLFSAVLSTIVVSKLVYKSYPEWFFFATAGISAVTALGSTLLNFFIVHDALKREEKNLNLIHLEIVKYDNELEKRYIGKDREYNLFVFLEAIIGSGPAREEAGYE